MTKFNLQSVSFAIVVLVLVLMSQTEGRVREEAFSPSDVGDTSLAAQALNPQLDVIETPQNDVREVIDKKEEKKSISKTQLIVSAKPEPSKPVTKPPKINASSALVKEFDSYSSFFEKNINKRWPLASITKLMTAIVAMDNIKPEQKITINEKAVNTEGVAGGFKIGEVFTASDLIRTMLVISSNDAAVALADFYGYPEFVNLMRKKTFEIQMNETTFFDPAGLSILNQSNIPDLEKLANYILKTYPQLFKITSMPGTEVLELKSGKTRRIPANNKFAGLRNFVGGKTGYTEEASGNLISVFDYNGRRFLIVVFGTENRFEETQKLYNWLRNNI